VGLDLFLQAAEKEQAKKTTGKADLTSIALIVPKVPLKNPANASRAVYRLTLKNDKPFSFDLPQTDMQKVLAKGPNYLDVQITRQSTKAFANQPSQPVPQKLRQYLRSSLYLDWKNPALKAAAQGIRVDSQNPWDLARALWKYANQTISTKDLGVYFDTASKVLASRRGDCTEHAVLLAALARARGLPSRIVTGLVQVSGLAGRGTVFGYHAWTEVWINGQWISLDAAMNQAPADVSHIALGVSALNSSDPAADTAGGLLQVIGNLEIEVLQQE
jgi:transglutaminase-like putative cysteine protease